MVQAHLHWACRCAKKLRMRATRPSLIKQASAPLPHNDIAAKRLMRCQCAPSRTEAQRHAGRRVKAMCGVHTCPPRRRMLADVQRAAPYAPRLIAARRRACGASAPPMLLQVCCACRARHISDPSGRCAAAACESSMLTRGLKRALRGAPATGATHLVCAKQAGRCRADASCASSRNDRQCTC